MADPEPLEDIVVNDRFWLKWARDAFGNSVERLDKAADRLTSAVGWFWTVYTAIAVIGVALADREFRVWQTALIFSPVGLLVAAYVAAGWAALPVPQRYDPRVPEQIQAAGHQYAVGEKLRRLRWAGGLLVLSAVVVVVAGAIAAFSDDQRDLETFRVTSTKVVRDGDGTTLIIDYGNGSGGTGEWQRPAEDESLRCFNEAVVGAPLPVCLSSVQRSQ